jgi:hypothetical protein
MDLGNERGCIRLGTSNRRCGLSLENAVGAFHSASAVHQSSDRGWQRVRWNSEWVCEDVRWWPHLEPLYGARREVHRQDFFVTPEVGWLAGTNELSEDLNGRVAYVLRTTDGGRSWKSCQIPSDRGVADIRDLFFLNESDGWLITWHFNNEGTHLFRTTDGGKTWRLHPDRTIQGPGKWLSVVRFLNSKVGFAFNRED